MKPVTTIGLDIAKFVFQVHGVDAAGTAVARQKLSRSRLLEFFSKLPRCLIGSLSRQFACSCSSDFSA